MGLAFQLQDDFLDVYGDTKVFGKAIGGDIVSNKKTYMLINAFARANEEQRAQLEYWVNHPSPDPQEKITVVTELYNEIGIHQMAIDKIKYYFQQSRQYLDQVQLPAERKAELQAYTREMMKREY